MTADDDATLVPPPMPSLSRAAYAAWAASPVPALLAVVAIAGRNHEIVNWAFFIAGVLNMYAWSAVLLYSRATHDWAIKAIPLSLGMCVANGIVFVLLSKALGMSPAVAP